MFWWNDPIEIIKRYTKRKNRIPFKNMEELLLKSVENLFTEEDIGMQTLELSKFSGLSNARDLDWGSLENYGNNLYLHFETNEDFDRLESEIFNSSSIKAAVYHAWTDRLYFCNSDKSHRLAALYRHNLEKNRDIRISINLCKKELNFNNVKILFNNFIGIITTDKTYSLLIEIFKSINITILLEEYSPEDGRLYILWIEKSQNKLLASIIKFISQLPSNQCYIITNVLEKYI
jgi:hypothetical protein